MVKKTKRVGDMLKEAGLISDGDLNAALARQKSEGGKLGSILIESGAVTEKMIAQLLEKQLGMKCVSLDSLEIPPQAVRAVKPQTADKYNIMPIDMDDRAIWMATNDPTDLYAIDKIGFAIGRSVKPVLALESDIRRAIEKYYGAALKAGAEPAASEIETEPSETEIKPAEIHTLTVSEMLEGHSTEEKLDALIHVLVDRDLITKTELLKKLGKK